MGLQRALSARRDRREALRREMILRVRRAAKALESQFRMESLHIVGSILGGRFRLTSDLDLVIKGAAVEDFHRIHAFLMGEVGGPLEIDLKPYEELSEESRRAVEEEGIRVI